MTAAPLPRTGPLRVVVSGTGAVLAERASVARSPVSRLVGLMGRRSLREGQALFFPSCQSIHTCFMRFAIDVVFVDRALRVVALRCALPPWRMTPVVWGAWGVIELPAGMVQETGLRPGDQLALRAIN